MRAASLVAFTLHVPLLHGAGKLWQGCAFQSSAVPIIGWDSRGLLPHLEDGRELAVGLEFGGQVAGLELFQEALVLRPEQADVWDAEQHHRQPLQSQAKSPCLLPLVAIFVQDLLLHNTAAHAAVKKRAPTCPDLQSVLHFCAAGHGEMQARHDSSVIAFSLHVRRAIPTSKHLQPLSIEEDLQLKGRVCEWEVGIHPSGLRSAQSALSDSALAQV